MKALQEELISFMFLRDEHGQLDVMACLALWFGKSNTTDIAINTRFGHHVAAALASSYTSWTSTARGCLALMILIDQFPRNIHRHTISSFAGDLIARSIATLPFDWLRELTPEECIFVPCLIMTHQEHLASQRAGVAFYNTLEPHLPPTLHIFRTIFEEHLRIIELCGTFPHRDHYYNRPTTPLGKQLMQNPKIRFDLPLIAENGCMKFGHDPRKPWLATQRAFDALERIEALANETGRRGSAAPASWLDEAEVAECRETFRAFDKDGNGFFDRSELGTVLASAGRVCEAEQLQMAMDRISGVVGTARVTFEEFSALFRAKLDVSLEARAQRRFSLFDKHKSGEIDLAELRACIQSVDDLVTGAEVEEMLRACDVDGNGQVSLEEFVAMMPLMGEVPKGKVVEVVGGESAGVVVDVVVVQELDSYRWKDGAYLSV